MSHTNHKPEETEASGGRRGIMGLIREMLPYIIILAVVLLLRVFVLINANIPSESMEDTISRQSRVMGLKTAYWFSDPQRGDIIVFDAPDEPEKAYVKRIIGVAGDTVEVRDGHVYLNGVELQEDYLKEEMQPGYGDIGPLVVPEGSYFCMGDNRNWSWDARFWTNTWVTDDVITGKVYFGYWPKPKWIADSAGDTFAEFSQN